MFIETLQKYKKQCEKNISGNNNL